MTAGSMPHDILSTDALRAGWAREGLQADALSVENGAIMHAASRWPLLIDPQLQGIRWIKSRERGLVVIQQGQPKYIDQARFLDSGRGACALVCLAESRRTQVVRCIRDGLPLLIENLPEAVDAVMDAVIGKQTIRRGRALLLRLGDAEVEVNPGFR